MISIIVCSRDRKMFDAFAANVEKTAGEKCEMIRIDNSEGKLSIFEAYNKGVEKAKGDLLCFCHEDVIFHTDDWAVKIARHFAADPELGEIGFCGSSVMLKGYDWRYMTNCTSGNYVQCFQTMETDPRWFKLKISVRSGKVKNALTRVVAVDGLCFFIPAKLFGTISFDAKTFNGFHQYDTDISLQVNKAGKKVCVCMDVLPEHFSTGAFNLSYFDSETELLKKWDSFLPLNFSKKRIDDELVKYAEAQKRFNDSDKQKKDLLIQKLKNGEALNAEEQDLQKAFILFYHHVFNKFADSYKEARTEIRRSVSRGFLNASESRYFRFKAFLYQILLKRLFSL